jgi:Asp-tRNA(Asn)/Glu-tRNA(Gln) amidotransferase A subunit family amidase
MDLFINDSSLERLTAVEAKRGVAHGILDAAKFVRACLRRIAERESDVHAWAWHDPVAVEKYIGALDAIAADAPLRGIPIGIKDIIDTADMPTEYGSAAYTGNRPSKDAEVVRRLRQAGAVMMGKTVTTEFAYAHPGPTCNPRALDHTPGGSSSGSAAAVSDFMVPVALGTQTGGSTIRPSAFCGIVGFKPTFGAVPLEGVRPLSPSMDTIGIHSRSVADTALVYSVLRDKAPGIQAGVPREPSGRIAYCPSLYGDQADPASHRALERVRDLIEAKGMVVSTLELPSAFGHLSQANRVIMAVEASRTNGEIYDRAANLLGPATRTLIETGRSTSEEQYQSALALARECREQHEELMQGYDALLTFSAPGEAPLSAQGTGDSIFNRTWTTIGVPCLTLPCGRGSVAGLPLGAQLVGGLWQDDVLLEVSARLEGLLIHVREQEV